MTNTVSAEHLPTAGLRRNRLRRRDHRHGGALAGARVLRHRRPLLAGGALLDASDGRITLATMGIAAIGASVVFGLSRTVREAGHESETSPA
jgi:hypothetical protein